MVIPPQFLPMMVVVGYHLHRNGRRRRKSYRGPARVSGVATRARPSSPGGMDGERIRPRSWHPHGHGHALTRNRHNRACIRR